jgi:hypothetical protein
MENSEQQDNAPTHIYAVDMRYCSPDRFRVVRSPIVRQTLKLWKLGGVERPVTYVSQVARGSYPTTIEEARELAIKEIDEDLEIARKALERALERYNAQLAERDERVAAVKSAPLAWEESE